MRELQVGDKVRYAPQSGGNLPYPFTGTVVRIEDQGWAGCIVKPDESLSKFHSYHLTPAGEFHGNAKNFKPVPPFQIGDRVRQKDPQGGPRGYEGQVAVVRLSLHSNSNFIALRYGDVQGDELHSPAHWTVPEEGLELVTESVDEPKYVVFDTDVDRLTCEHTFSREEAISEAREQAENDAGVEYAVYKLVRVTGFKATAKTTVTVEET